MIESMKDGSEISGEILPHSKSAKGPGSSGDSSAPDRVPVSRETTEVPRTATNSQLESTETQATKAASMSSPKLRRKVSVEESLDNAVSVQRLVEYFLVVSCHPRWETNNMKRGNNQGGEGQVDSNGSKRSSSPTNQRCNETTGTNHAINHSLSTAPESGRSDDETREDPSTAMESNDPLPPPKPRETWNREEGAEENIRLPGSTGVDTGMECSHAFSPKVTARFPLEDHSDHPLNPMITQFCFPVGDTIYPSKDYSMPSVHHFVMTNDKGRKVYGTCLTIYEEYQPPENTPWRDQLDILYPTWCAGTGIEVSVNPEGNRLYIPRCLCILSIWPYVNAFREYLAQLYRLATSTDCMQAPIERYVMNLCMEIPAPPPGAFEVKISILDSVIRFWSPPAKLPIAYVSLPYQTLFDCLDIENILHLWYCLSMERKVLLVSSQHSILTVCSEILCSLLYPMKWSHLYVPLLPNFLCPILDAPVPYLCGVTRENWINVRKFVCRETIVVDLDRNSVMFGQETMELPPVPGRKWLKLKKSLQENAGHLFWRGRGLEAEYQELVERKIDQSKFKNIAEQKGERVWKEKLETLDQAFNLQYTPDSEHLVESSGEDHAEQNQWDRVQEAFLRFFVAIFKDYRNFLHIPKMTEPGSTTPVAGDWLNWGQNHKFDRAGFIASQKANYFPYLSDLCSTQQFDDFITKRLYSPELPDVIFFDQSIDAKLNRSRLKLKKVHTPFLQSAKAHKQLETFVAVEPNVSDLPNEAPFIYETWPEKFEASLFCQPRPIPSMITAEFDRQSSLVKQLQMNCSPAPEEGPELMNLYGSDYDYSPEGMSFTVFFFTYSAVIGREWQAYQQKRREIESGTGPNDLNVTPEERNAEDSGRNDGEGISTNISPADNPLSDLTLGACGGVVCPGGESSVDDLVEYVSSKNPCPDLNVGAQAAYDTLANFVSSLDPENAYNAGSLLDNDEAFAEYEEAREVAVAQLHLAFDALRTMESRGLTTDPDVFKSLMGACGRCGNTKRALELIEIMKRDGLVADHDVLVCFMAAFAHSTPEEDNDVLSERNLRTMHRGPDAYSQFLKKKLMVMTGDSEGNVYNLPVPSDEENSMSDGLSESGSEYSTENAAYPGFLQIFTTHTQKTSTMTTSKKKQKRPKRKKRMARNTPEEVSDRMKKQLALGESLLEFLYPNIFIDTFGDACPMCSNVMKEDDIVSGWQQCDFQDFTTACPQCSHRFVPRFKVSCSSPLFEGSQGPGTPLYCEFLSPWVLRKELGRIVGPTGNMNQMLDPAWRSGRDVKATIWWNLIAMLRRYQLPFSFLLQGSFRNRLINPAPQD